MKQNLEFKSAGIKIQALESQIRSNSRVQNAGKFKSRPWKAKSARIPASRMQENLNQGALEDEER